MLPERPLSYRAGDDEDHRLALCGLTPDERFGEELEDFQTRHYDFIFTRGRALEHTMGERRQADFAWSAAINLRVSPPSAKQGPGDAGRSATRIGVAVSPGPAPYF